MKKMLMILFIPLMLVGCDDVKKAGDETAREITSANMIDRDRVTQQQLKAIDQQQQERFKQLDQQ